MVLPLAARTGMTWYFALKPLNNQVKIVFEQTIA
jgi:hypothetical protein